MKILILYTYNRGYLSSFFFELSTRLAKEGHEVTNFSLKREPNEFSLDGIDLIIKKKGGYISNYNQIYKIIKSLKPDVVLSNFSYVNPALLFGKLLGVKKNMVWFHSLNEQMESTKLDIFLKKIFLKLADVVVANSFLTEKELQVIYNVPRNRLTTIPFWSNISESNQQADVSKFTQDTNVFKIGCPGRMAKHKNHRVVIEAVSKIKEMNHFDIILYLAGDGEEFANLKKSVVDNNLENKVKLLGHLSADEMITFYNTMDVIVLPSLHEAFGLVFIEAISMGVPVIVSSQFGALSFIDKDTLSKFTFNPKSSNELVGKLIDYFKNESLSKENFKQLYDKNFNKDVIFKNILDNMIGNV